MPGSDSEICRGGGLKQGETSALAKHAHLGEQGREATVETQWQGVSSTALVQSEGCASFCCYELVSSHRQIWFSIPMFILWFLTG